MVLQLFFKITNSANLSLGSGEALSLMKQLEKLVANRPGKIGDLSFMVIYKNSQKMLADVLGAADEITLYYYHQSTSYKYHGRFAAEKILSSVNSFMSLKSEEVPLKTLYTQNELKIFLKSTDKAVLLIELCGWSSKLLHKKSIKNFTAAQMNYLQDGLFSQLIHSVSQCILELIIINDAILVCLLYFLKLIYY